MNRIQRLGLGPEDGHVSGPGAWAGGWRARSWAGETPPLAAMIADRWARPEHFLIAPKHFAQREPSSR